MRILFLFILSAVFFLPADMAAQIPGIVLGNGINIRSGSGTQFDVILKGRIGDIYSVETIDNNGWFKIRLPEKVNGFIRKDFLKKPTESSFPMTVEVNGSRVNVRVGPEEDSRWLTRFYHGDKLRAYSEVGDWYNIQYDNVRYGYIIAKYFDLLDNRKGYITADCVNIRSGPSLENAVVAKLYIECPVIYLDQDADWYKVKIRGGPVGWISKRYVNFPAEFRSAPAESQNETPETNRFNRDNSPLDQVIPDTSHGFEELNFNDN